MRKRPGLILADAYVYYVLVLLAVLVSWARGVDRPKTLGELMVESKKLDDMDNAWQRGFQAYMAEAFSDPRTSPPAPKAKDRSDTGPSVEGWSGTRSDGSSLAFAHLSTSVQMYSNHPGAAVEIEIRRAPETV